MATTTPVDVTVSLPTVEEISRIIDEFFAAQPLEIAYAVIQGDDEGNIETGEYTEKSADEQERVKNVAMRYWWLSAARKRLAKP